MIEVGDPAPGFPTGAIVALVGDAPRIDAEGAVSLVVNVRGVAGRPVLQALYRAEPPGLPELAVRSGDEVPGETGLFASFPALPATPRIDRDRLTFAATTDTPGAGSAGIWSDRVGGFAPLVRVGDRLAAMPDGTALIDFSFSTRGSDVLLVGTYGDGGPVPPGARGLWRNRSRGWEPLVVGGEPAPNGVHFGTDPTQAFGPFFAFDAVAGGPAVVQAWVAGPGIDGAHDEALWIADADGSGLSPLAREGDHPPDRPDLTFGPTEGSPTFGGLGENLPVVVSPCGDVAFGAVVTGARGRLNSVWTIRGGESRPVVFGAPSVAGFGDGDPAPGMAPGATFATFEAGALDAAGRLAIQAAADEGDDAAHPTRGLWWDRGRGLELVAAAGREAPGLPGVTLADVRFERVTDAGVLLFTARLSGPGVTTGDDRALYAAADGGVAPMLREGDPARVASRSGARVRTVAAFRLGEGVSRDGRTAVEVVFRDRTAGVYRLALPVTGGAP